MTIQKLKCLLLLVFAFQLLSAQDEIFTVKGKVYQVVLLELNDDVIVFYNMNEATDKVKSMHLSKVKDFKFDPSKESTFQFDNDRLMKRLRMVKDQNITAPKEIVSGRGTGPTTSSEINTTVDINSGNKKSALEQNYLNWEWEQRAKDVAFVKDQVKQNQEDIKKYRSKKHAVQINFVSMLNKAYNLKYNYRYKSQIVLEGAFYAFNVSEPRQGGSGIATDVGIRYLFLNSKSKKESYYRKSQGLGIAAVVGYTSSSSYSIDITNPGPFSGLPTTEINKVWNRSVIYVGPDLNCRMQLIKNLFVDVAVGAFRLIGDHTLLQDEMNSGPIEQDNIENYFDGSLAASNNIAVRFGVSLGYAF